MAGFGRSPGEFHFAVTLVGKVVASCVDDPPGAVQQYYAFSVELGLVSTYLEESQIEVTELVALWRETKAQRVNFAKYASLETTITPGERRYGIGSGCACK